MIFNFVNYSKNSLLKLGNKFKNLQFIIDN